MEKSIIFFVSFVLAIIGLRLYRSMILQGPYPSLIRMREEPIVNGGGGLFWDIFFIFLLYEFWYGGLSFSWVLFWGAGALSFTLMGWLDDLLEFSPFKKLILQAMLSIIFLGAYKFLAYPGMSLLEGFWYLFLLLWFLNEFNFIDIMDGLAGSIGITYFLTFIVLLPVFGFHYRVSLFALGLLLAFLCFNLKPSPMVYMGDAGAHFLGFLLFFLTLSFLHGDSQLGGRWDVMAALYGFLIFDFSFVCIQRLRKGKSLFLKSPDHFPLVLSTAISSSRKRLVFLLVFQVLFCITAIQLIRL